MNHCLAVSELIADKLTFTPSRLQGRLRLALCGFGDNFP